MDKVTLFEEQIYCHYQYVFKYVYFMCRSRQEAEDITQEVMIKAWQYLGRFLSDPKGKLKVTAYRKFVDFYRRKKISPLNWEGFESFPDHNADVPTQIIKKETVANLRKALPRLKETYYKIIYMFYERDMTIREIATVRSQPYSTVTTQKQRAVLKLANIMAEQ